MPTANRPNSRLRHTMLCAVLGLAGFVLVGIDGPAAQDARFVQEVADLPLMPGLSEVKDAGVVFDKPDGRIVEAYAQGEVERAAVLRFYSKTLPQLGWHEAGATNFQREGEKLSLDFLDGGGALIVRFTLTPE